MNKSEMSGCLEGEQQENNLKTFWKIVHSNVPICIFS